MDSSALVKLLAAELESSTLRQGCRGRQLVASSLVLVEVPRAARRLAPESFWASAWNRLMGQIRLVDLDRSLLIRAGRLPPSGLRSLDAIHLATALAIPGLDAFVGYDDRLQSAATAVGLLALSPGVP